MCIPSEEHLNGLNPGSTQLKIVEDRLLLEERSTEPQEDIDPAVETISAPFVRG